MIEILKIGFLHLTLIDLIDILVVSLPLSMRFKGSISSTGFIKALISPPPCG